MSDGSLPETPAEQDLVHDMKDTQDASPNRTSNALDAVVHELNKELAASRDALHQAREEQAELRSQLAKGTPAGGSSSSSDQSLQKETEELRVQLKDVEAMAERATAAKAVAELRLQLGAVNARGEDQKKLARMEDQLKAAEKREAQASSEEQTATRLLQQAEQRGEEKNVALGQLSTKLADAQQQNALLQARLDQLESRLEDRLEQQEVRAKEREESMKMELLGGSQSAQIFKSELAAQEARNDELSFELNEARRVMSAAPWERDMEEQRLQLNRVKEELRIALNRIQEFEGREGPSAASWDGAFNDKADQAAGAPYKPGSTLIRKAKAKVSLRNAAHVANRARDTPAPPNFVFADPHDAQREAGDVPQMHRRMSDRRMAENPDSPSHVMRVLQEEVNWQAPESRHSREPRGPEPISNASVAGPGHSPTNFASTMARNRALAASRSPAQPLTRGQRVGQGLTRTRGSAVLNFERRLAAQEALGLNGNNLQGGQGSELRTNNDRGRQERRGDPRPYRGGWRRGDRHDY